MTGLFAILLATAFAEANAQPEAIANRLDEQEVIAEVNRVRADPAAYARHLGDYRRHFRGNVVQVPGARVATRTTEGAAVVDEAIDHLSRQQPLAPFAESPLLAQAAADHARAQGPTGRIGHAGTDGLGPGERVRRRGGGTFIAEVISYGPDSAAEAVRQLIIDDGVPSRGHRQILLSARYAFAGAACGPHAAFGTMCVIKLSATATGHYAPLR